MMREIGNFYQNSNERKMGTCGRFDRMKAPNDRQFSSYFAKFSREQKQNEKKTQENHRSRKRFFPRSVPCIFSVFETLSGVVVGIGRRSTRSQVAD